MSQPESNRIKRGLMVWCALILFALGIWLLVEPVKSRGAGFHSSDQDTSQGTPELVDNVVAVGAQMAALSYGRR